MAFKIVSENKPKGDQPQAIKKLIEGLDKRKQSQVLLGVTGSGKTFTIANVIEKYNRPRGFLLKTCRSAVKLPLRGTLNEKGHVTKQ